MHSTAFSSLPFKRTALSCIGLLCAGAASAQSGDVLTQWREYARLGVMPEYSWSDAEPSVAPTLLDTLQADASLLRTASFAAVGFTGARLSMGFSSSAVGESAARAATPRPSVVDFDGPRNVIKNEFVSSTYESALGQRGRFGITAIVARQRFASDGLGAAAWNPRVDLIGVRDINGRRPEQEVSAGHGVRLGYWAPLDSNLAWSVSAQSKMEMDAFKSFRGVYSEAGDFDVPGRVEARLSWAPVSFATLALGVDRVYYSDIDAFTSAALPTRFLSLLGDGGSPAFAWRDLTVYSIEGAIADRWDGRWSLRYTSTQQPSPTSELLSRALEDMSSNNVMLGYSHGIGRLGELAFNASYSADAYFLGATPYTQRDFDRSSQLEVEAVFSVPF